MATAPARGLSCFDRVAEGRTRRLGAPEIEIISRKLKARGQRAYHTHRGACWRCVAA